MGTDTRTVDPPGLGSRLRRYLSEARSLVTRNDRHQDRLDEVDISVAVSGTRGKSTLVRWLHDRLVARDYDTYAKLTGTEPLSIYNGRERIIPRHGRTTLYENEREIRAFFPMDAIVVENQGITPYTTRLVNARYLDAGLVVVTNIREDHLDTLGSNRERVARSLARSVPAEAHVICGEQGSAVRDYFAAELEQRGATVTFADVPAEYMQAPGAELIYCLDETLREVDDRGLDEARTEAYLDSLRVEWRHLPAGRVFDAASVNDVQSTEAIRRALPGGPEAVIQPLVYLRRDRPGRTASYARYLDLLAEQGVVEQVRVVDGHAAAFDTQTSVPVVVHSPSEPPDSVLSGALADGWPVVLMGNATPEFMQALRRVIDQRARAPAAAAPTPHDEEASLERVAAAGTQVLLLEWSSTEPADVFCTEILTAQPLDRIMFVALGRSSQEHIEKWQTHAGDAATDQFRFLTVDDTIRSVAAAKSSPTRPGTPGDLGPVTAVDDIADLAELLEILLDDWEVLGQEIGVCVDSVPRIVDEYSLEQAFRLLHFVTRQLDSAGVTAHYHFPVEGYDQQTIGTLEPLFDVVVTLNEDGDVRINP